TVGAVLAADRKEKTPPAPAMTGAAAALPAWTDFMIGAGRGRPVEDFPLPVGSTSREICAETGMLATVNCPAVTTEIFHEGAEPSETCSQHPGPPLKSATPGVPRPLPDPRRLDEPHT